MYPQINVRIGIGVHGEYNTRVVAWVGAHVDRES